MPIVIEALLERLVKEGAILAFEKEARYEHVGSRIFAQEPDSAFYYEVPFVVHLKEGTQVMLFWLETINSDTLANVGLDAAGLDHTGIAPERRTSVLLYPGTQWNKRSLMRLLPPDFLGKDPRTYGLDAVLTSVELMPYLRSIEGDENSALN